MEEKGGDDGCGARKSGVKKFRGKGRRAQTAKRGQAVAEKIKGLERRDIK